MSGKFDKSGRFKIEGEGPVYTIVDQRAESDEGRMIDPFPPRGKASNLTECKAMIEEYLATGKWDLPQWYRNLGGEWEQVNDARFPSGYQRSATARRARSVMRARRRVERVSARVRKAIDGLNESGLLGRKGPY
jgi:hypothetical protein